MLLGPNNVHSRFSPNNNSYVITVLLTNATLSGHWSTRCHTNSGKERLGSSTSGRGDLTMCFETLASRCCCLHTRRRPDLRKPALLCIAGHQHSVDEWEMRQFARNKRREVWRQKMLIVSFIGSWQWTQMFKICAFLYGIRKLIVVLTRVHCCSVDRTKWLDALRYDFLTVYFKYSHRHV
jgi:hypothetical protein